MKTTIEIDISSMNGDNIIELIKLGVIRSEWVKSTGRHLELFSSKLKDYLNKVENSCENTVLIEKTESL